MYGLCHHGIKHFAIHTYGETVWRCVEDRLGITNDADIELHAYFHDDVTAQLLRTVVEECGEPPEVVMQKFGFFWINYTKKSEFGCMMGFNDAPTLVDYLASVNDLHARLESVLPKLTCPQFEVEQIDEHHFELSYYSPREGLAAMVLGLVEALAIEYNQKVDIQQIQHKGAHSCHQFDKFMVSSVKVQMATANSGPS